VWNQNEHLQNPTQFGGVAILTVNKMTYQVDSSCLDPSGLGRWTLIRLRSKHGSHTRIVTCYRPVKNEKGPMSTYNQQRRYFLQQQVDTCPLQKYLTDLKSTIELWQEEGNLLIIGSDWNEDVLSPTWRNYWNNLGLVSPQGLIQHHPTATYNRGRKQLDMVYVSPALYQLVSGYLQCNEMILGADHSALWLDIPLILLHLQAPPPYRAPGRRLKTDSPSVRDNYLVRYKRLCKQHHLLECAKALWSSVQDGKPLTIEQTIEYETIDAIQTKSMNEAERYCRELRMGAIDWSPELALA